MRMNRIARMSIVMGFIYLLCMFRNPAGITFPVFVIAVVIACGYITKIKKYDIVFTDYLYAVCCVLISISIMLTDSGFLHFFGKVGILLLIMVYFIKKFYGIENMGLLRGIIAILEFMCVSVSHIPSPFLDYRKQKEDSDSWEQEEDSVKSQIVKGLIIAVPLLIVVGVLLVSADVVFKNILSNVFDSSADMEVLFKMFLTFVIGFIGSYAVARTVCDRKLKLYDGKLRRSQPITAITFTSLMSVIYVFFCGVQITMLFNRNGHMLPPDYSYSRYAREGFFQLLFVALINFAIVFICKIKFEKNRILDIILTIITVCTYVMIASSAGRMIVYIKEYHFTFLRLFVLWFLFVLALMMAGLIISVYRDTFKLFEYCVVVVSICYVILSFARPDALVAKYNVEYLDKEGDQIEYMTTLLSDDAAPYLAEIEKENYMLTEYFERIYDTYELRDIRKFNVSQYQAYNAAKEYLKK